MEYNGYHILSKWATKIVVFRERNRGTRLTLSQVCASSSLYLILFQNVTFTDSDIFFCILTMGPDAVLRITSFMCLAFYLIGGSVS